MLYVHFEFFQPSKFFSLFNISILLGCEFLWEFINQEFGYMFTLNFSTFENLFTVFNLSFDLCFCIRGNYSNKLCRILLASSKFCVWIFPTTCIRLPAGTVEVDEERPHPRGGHTWDPSFWRLNKRGTISAT